MGEEEEEGKEEEEETDGVKKGVRTAIIISLRSRLVLTNDLTIGFCGVEEG